MRQIYKSLFIVLFVLTICAWGIYPPHEKLRLGKDLRGGVSLTYSVQTRVVGGQDPKQLLDQTIEVLKNRVDPDGLFEISIVAQGTDRIEITMPLPGDRVKELRKKFEDELTKLAQASLNEASVRKALASPNRSEEFKRLGAQNPRRETLLQNAAAAWDAASAKRAAYEAETDATKKDALAGEVAGAELAYDAALKKVLETALSAESVRHVVGLSPKPRQFTDREGKLQMLPSPRDDGERRLRESHPDAIPDIERVINAYNQYARERKSLDDPEDLKRLLRGAGVLSFRIACKVNEHPLENELRRRFRERGPRGANAEDARWYRLNRIDGWLHSKEAAEELAKSDANAAPYFQASGYVVEARSGEYYMLCWDTPNKRLTLEDHQDQPWAVAAAYQGHDEVGKPAIHFRMDAVGGRYLGQLTRLNVGNQMAVLLDDEVYTAPNLRSAISNDGQITGEFSQEEIAYVVRVLSGGSLQQALSPDPISENTVAPELGADNLTSGLWSGIYAAVLVSAFMIVYYFGCGLIAVIALAANAICILGAMSFAKAAFTMPGIAGIVLTFSQAVDANVLIYERMREELKHHADMRAAVRVSFHRATPSIVDANVSHLIICLVLYNLGTQEIRGFAVSLGIGVVATLFTALVVSRLIFNVLVEWGHWRHATMLPVVVPALQRILEPKINWIGLRPVFMAISAIVMTAALTLVVVRGSDTFDTEFRGGTQVTIELKRDPANPEKHMTMTRANVEHRLREIKATAEEKQLSMVRDSEVIPINPEADGVSSDLFKIKTTATDANVVTTAMRNAFEDVTDVEPELAFNGSVATKSTEGPLHRVDSPRLSQVIGALGGDEDVSAFDGGLAIVLEDIHPQISLASLKDRLARERRDPMFSDTFERQWDVRVLKGTPEKVHSVVYLVSDPTIKFVDDEDTFETKVAQREWSLVREATLKAKSFSAVESFTPSVAATFAVKALLATAVSLLLLIIYIWFRYGTLRWSLAAVLPLVHDATALLGLLALSQILQVSPATQDMAIKLGILPFRIDLNMVAALLMIIGFSLNDKVIILDRIRENRGKLPYATSQVVNDSINQTFSRTLITSGTTLMTTIILYVFGGEGVRGFAYAFTLGIIIGTYSSIALAAPIVWSRRREAPAEAVLAQPTI